MGRRKVYHTQVIELELDAAVPVGKMDFHVSSESSR